MCGINGVVPRHPQARESLNQKIAAMNAAIAHRGPDGTGVFSTERLGLGHVRLAIIDLSEAGAQPMTLADAGLTLVFNGEIYNYLEIAEELRSLGHVFVGHSDTEVLLHAYRQWGEDCVQRFNGMWAFAIWDARRQRLFASRDRLGVKPFVYHQSDDAFHFSSEVAGLRAVLPLHEANAAKLHDYLAYGYRTNNGEGFYKNVFELKPGHNLVWEDGRITMRRYWSLPQSGERRAVPASERAEAYAELLRDAVRLRLRSDVPVALLQSGGVDSSVICTVVDDEVGKAGAGAHAVRAYTATFPGEPVDESAAVRALMTRCPNIHSVELTPSGEDLAVEHAAYVRAMQEPKAGPPSFAHWRLMRAIRMQGTKVVVNGQGADEALAGYGSYITGYRLLDLFQRNPLEALREAKAMRSHMGFSAVSLTLQMAKAMAGRRAASHVRSRYVERALPLLAPEFHREHDAYLPNLTMSWHGDNLDRHLRSQLEDYGFNQILHYEDLSSMNHGIEIRSPFVDYRLMEFAFTLPDEAKFSRGVTKKVLRDAFDARVPHSIIRSSTKIGFGVPWSEWLRRPAMQAYIRSVVDSPAFRQRTLWNGDEVARRLQEPVTGGMASAVWRFLMAAVWLDQAGITNV
ncbi:MAG: asparagine synthase (glutamine-hydrolyzing) [Burkholderiaceae bacterium]|nr:asparagine synthase (glutamine-hydrolyzing) [Roseateles sp.]MBV8469802.1 asparagine synthase (glutamine-hydrolyzing) [Burkholderiaceae bacterium]